MTDICSFCRTPRKERRVFIVAPDGNVICDACVELATTAAASEEEEEEPEASVGAKVIDFAAAIARRAEAT